MITTAPKIGRRLALWHELCAELQRRHRLELPCPNLDFTQIVEQISVAARLEILWQCEPNHLANQILDKPFEIPKGDELFELDRSISYVELGPELDELLGIAFRAIAGQSLQRKGDRP